VDNYGDMCIKDITF